MSDRVQFEEDEFLSGSKAKMASLQNKSSTKNRFFSDDAKNSSGMAGWLIRKGIVHSDLGAQLFMIVLVIINIVITVLLFKYFV